MPNVCRQAPAEQPSRRPCEDEGMSVRFEELAWQQTPMGEISLRRRLDPALNRRCTRSSSATSSSCPACSPSPRSNSPASGSPNWSGRPSTGWTWLSVAWGSGTPPAPCWTTIGSRSLIVVDALDEVIAWHQQGLLPFAAVLTTDPRCRLLHGDFFALTADPIGYDPDRLAGGSTRYFSTSITAHGTCCIPGTRVSTPPTACAGWPHTCTPAACSASGPTTRPTTRSPPCWARSSQPPGPRSSRSTTPCNDVPRRTPSTLHVPPDDRGRRPRNTPPQRSPWP